MIPVNGKVYPMWSQFVEQSESWVGGTLEDHDRGTTVSTLIKGITLTPNGDTSAFFTIKGEDFSCGFDVKHGGLGGAGEKGWISFVGYGGHTFRIKQP